MDHAKRVTDNRVRPTREKADTLRGPTSNKNSRANLIIVIIIIIMVCDTRNTISYLPTERWRRTKKIFFFIVFGVTLLLVAPRGSVVSVLRPSGRDDHPARKKKKK